MPPGKELLTQGQSPLWPNNGANVVGKCEETRTLCETGNLGGKRLQGPNKAHVALWRLWIDFATASMRPGRPQLIPEKSP